jgi:hypothetical protein
MGSLQSNETTPRRATATAQNDQRVPEDLNVSP